MKVKSNWVPSAFTLGNMFSGYFSIILSANGKFVHAAWFIVAAAVLDILDGKIARFANVASHFGVEYDSMADVVSFGVAPSFLIYKSVFAAWGNMGLFISIGPLVFGSVRLARFNIRAKGSEKSHFEGLPIPAAAVTISSFLVFNYHFWEKLRWEKVYLFVVIAVSVLMVTTMRFESFPNFNIQKDNSNRTKILVVFIGIGLIILFPQEAFFPLAIAYVFSGPLRLGWLLLKGDSEKEPKKSKDKMNEGNNKGSAKKRNSRSTRKSGE